MRKWFKVLLVGLLSLVTFSGCAFPGGGNSSSSESDSTQADGYYTVKFELCTDLKTNTVVAQEIEEGDVVVKPSVGVIGENVDRMEIDGWYTEPEYKNEWNFTLDVVESDMTLYAKWVKKFAVTYYLGDEVDTHMYVRYVKEGDLVPYQPELADGYESKGFFTTARHEEKFDFTKPVTSDVNIYIHRSENFYFSGKMIANRFQMQQEYAQGGTIEYVEEDDGEGYAKLNFGYSKSADPHALLQNVTVDISASQKVEVVFKNMGPAQSLRFYYLNWMADGTNTDGPAFNENSTFTYTYAANEMNMKPEDEWVTKVFDFSSILTNGVSNWGISSTMIRLRIQSGYISADENDRSNEIWIKSIKGIPDDTYTSTDDTERVTNLRVHDDPNAVENAANAQEDVMGWIFPKDYSAATAMDDNGEIYEKTNGLLFYSKFRKSEVGLSLKVPTDAEGNKEVIDLNNKTTIRIRLTNFGHANKLRLEYKGSSGVRSKEFAIEPCGDEPVSKVYELNMFGADRYEGELESLGFRYDSVGVDNAILFESIEFVDFKRIDIQGINMNDKYAGIEGREQAWTNVNNVTYIHNGGSLLDGGTIFTTEDGGSLSQDVNVTNLGYQSMSLKYKAVEGVHKVNVALTINDEIATYKYDVSQAPKEATPDENGNMQLVVEAGEVKDLSGWYEIYLPFVAAGQVTNISVSFEGAGTITLQEIRFNMDKNSGVDFSDPAYTGYIIARDWDGEIINYDNTSSSASVTAWEKVTVDEDGREHRSSGAVRYYFGAMILGNIKVGEGSVDISEKSKIIVIYNNQGEIKNLTLGIGLTNVTEDGAWKDDISQVFDKDGGKVQVLELQQNMAENEWVAVEVDLTQFENLDNGTAGKAITGIMLQQTNSTSTEKLSIRAVIIL